MEARKEFKALTAVWEGPKGYCIVYKTGDKYALMSAKYIKAFFEKYDGVTLELVTDSADETEFEILVGDTNRYETALDANHFAVTLKDKKLIFEGGHRVMVEKAVKWFMSLPRKAGEVETLTGHAPDFKPTVTIGGEEFNYVWGDEFDGNFLDKTKFEQYTHMGFLGDDFDIKYDDPDTMRVEDGMLKCFIRKNTNPDSKAKYNIPESICSGRMLWYQYGYVEIRVKLPLKHGSWCGWWMTSHCRPHPEDLGDWQYLAEVDIYEVTGSDCFEPNLHKWFKNYAGTFRQINLPDGREVRQGDYRYGGKTPEFYHVPEAEDISEVYYTVGFRWNCDEMVMSIDGIEYNRFDLNYNFMNYSDMRHFKNGLFHFILNTCVFSDSIPWAGTPAMRMTAEDDENLPYEQFVEYVRLYQKPGEGYINNLGLDLEVQL